MCACGRPRFWNSITYRWATTRPKMPSANSSSHSCLSLSLKTRASRSGRSCGCWPGSSSRVISSHRGLHVFVMKRDGLPFLRTHAMPSWYRCPMSRGPPVNDDGSTMRLPAAMAPSPSCAATASARFWYNSARIAFWLSRSHLSLRHVRHTFHSKRRRGCHSMTRKRAKEHADAPSHLSFGERHAAILLEEAPPARERIVTDRASVRVEQCGAVVVEQCTNLQSVRIVLAHGDLRRSLLLRVPCQGGRA